MAAFRYWRLWLMIMWAAVAAGALMSAPTQWFGSATDPHHLLDALGLVLVLLGGVVRLWAGAYIRRWKGKRLVRSGPYAFCRHPLYLGSLLAVLGVGTIMQHTGFAVASLVLCGGAYLAKIGFEERRLASRFGGAWEAYAESTPPLWPKVVRRWRARAGDTPCWDDAFSELGGVCMFLALALGAELIERYMSR